MFAGFISSNIVHNIVQTKTILYLRCFIARMAEQVDALVSKTSGSFPLPVRFRLRVLSNEKRGE
jgi:hypothetical protein